MKFLFSGLPFRTRFKYCNLCMLVLIAVTLVILIGHFGFKSASFTRPKREIKPFHFSVLSEAERSSKTSCRFHSCFEINNCVFSVKDRIGVYVYPEFEFTNNRTTQSYVPQLSNEYRELLDAIYDSAYLEPNISKACVYVPSVDVLNQGAVDVNLVSSLLNSLPGWIEGQNHLVFNMLPGSYPDFNTRPDFHYGKAMLAGGGFSRATYRHGFDVSIPVFNPLTREERYLTSAQNNVKRRLLTVLAHGWSHTDDLAQQLLTLAADNNDDVIVLEACPSGKVSHDLLPWKRCSASSGKVFDYPDILEASQFCLLVRGARYGTPDLTDVMMTGCVPVVLDDDYVLPFSEVLDWPRASVRVWSGEVGGTVGTLRRIPETMATEMRKQVLFLYKRYFSSMATIALATLDIINERVFPTSVHGYEWWNNREFDPKVTDHFQFSYPHGLSLPAPPSGEGFTAVILTYDRIPMLFEVIKSIANAPSLAKVLVVWNNVDKHPPPAEEWPRIKKPIQVIRSKHNRLSNRFFPYTEIRTAAVLSLDDDITMMTADELEFGYKAWQEFPDRLVGFPGRVHVFDYERGVWKYESNWLNNISLVLTGAAFYHMYYHHMYTHVMPRAVREWVDVHMNCEDIAMNFLIANYTGKPPIKVTPRKKFKCSSCTSEESLWSDPQHYLERDECINVFEKFFKGIPLETVKFRLDPVLYKDPIEDRFKLYPNMGEL